MKNDAENSTNIKQSSPIQPGWLSGRKQLSDYCGLSPRTLSRWIKEGKIPHKRVGHKIILFRIRDIDRALENLEVGVSE